METILLLTMIGGLDYSAGREDAAPRVSIDYRAGRETSPCRPAPASRPVSPSPSGAHYVARSYEWHLVRGETRPNLIAHLATPQPEHHGAYFERGWLSALSMRELIGLHSDAHNGRVQWQYVHRSAGPSKSAVSSRDHAATKAEQRAEKQAAKLEGRELYGTRDGKHPGPLGSAIRNFFGDPRYSTSRQFSSGCPNGRCPR